MDLAGELAQTFNTLDLAFCDGPGRKIWESPQMEDLGGFFPEWKSLIAKGLDTDEKETLRTIRHIFRSLKVYHAILDGSFETNVSRNVLAGFREDLHGLKRIHPVLFPLLLIFHDIGRPFNREWHTFESAKILRERELICKMTTPLDGATRRVLLGVIEHHLLMGTIFTGESSYVGASELLISPDVAAIWESADETDLFFRLMKAFTVVDIWGYDYSTIYDHYFTHYETIRYHLTRAFLAVRELPLVERAPHLLSQLRDLDQNNLPWRVACCLRIFQFVGTRPELTEEFYFNKLKKALEAQGRSWLEFQQRLGSVHAFIQFKYALPLMMILAAGEFFRKPIGPEEDLKPEIFQFWEIVCQIARDHTDEGPTGLWNFVFKFPWGWFFEKKHLQYVLGAKFFEDLVQAPVRQDKTTRAHLVIFEKSES